MTQSVLIVDDDITVQNFLQTTLVERGYHVITAQNGTTALALLTKTIPNVVLLDLRLPDISGDKICIAIKKRYPKTAIIFLTAHNSPQYEVEGLNLGADDYVTKPFMVDELLARIKIRLRKNTLGQNMLQVKDLILSKNNCEVKRGDKKITLTPKEFRLLSYFMTNKNQVLSREQILNIVWQYHYGITSRVVDIYIAMLRKKIDYGFSEKLFHSVRGFGYIMKE